MPVSLYHLDECGHIHPDRRQMVPEAFFINTAWFGNDFLAWERGRCVLYGIRTNDPDQVYSRLYEYPYGHWFQE